MTNLKIHTAGGGEFDSKRLKGMTASKDMTDLKKPVPTDNAAKKLLLSVSIGATAAILIVVLEILPAQYGIDLTGFGTYVGLTKIYRDKENLKQFRNTTDQEERMTIEIPVGEELEYKLYLRKGDRISFFWTADLSLNSNKDSTPDKLLPAETPLASDGIQTAARGEVFFEFHGEPEDQVGVHFESYTRGTSHQESDSFVAPFDGTHGWYLRNDLTSPITITLEVQGKFNLVGLKAAAFSR